VAERRKPSGKCFKNAAKPEGSRPAATKSQSKMSVSGRGLSGEENDHAAFLHLPILQTATRFLIADSCSPGDFLPLFDRRRL